MPEFMVLMIESEAKRTERHTVVDLSGTPRCCP